MSTSSLVLLMVLFLDFQHISMIPTSHDRDTENELLRVLEEYIIKEEQLKRPDISSPKYRKGLAPDCRRFYGTGSVSTPNYPQPYDNNISKCYIITASPDKVPWLTFEFMDIEYDDYYEECYDFLTVYYGDIAEDTLEQAGEFCGTSLPSTIIGRGRSMTLIFQSDLSTRGRGFLSSFQSKPRCGHRGGTDKRIFNEITPYVINGLEADTNEFPWQVSIRLLRPGQTPVHVCGATIVASNWILTAAHCLYYSQDNPRQKPLRIATWLIEIVIGEHDTTVLEGQEQILYVQDTFIHPHYNENNPPHPYNNDIALIRTKTSIRITATASPACVSNYAPPPATMCWTSGWGATTDPDGNRAPSSDILQKVSMPIMSKDNCNQRWANKISDSMLCAYRQGVGACQGDSGGPLVCEHSINDDTGSLYEGLYFVTGVTSWGSQSCSEDPSVFASVANVAQWISDTSQGEIPVLLN